MNARYHVVTILVHGSLLNKQVYIAEDTVTEQQILSGDDTGVVCLMLDDGKADLIAGHLNAAAEAGHV